VIELMLKKIEKMTKDIYLIKQTMLKELAIKQESINRMSLSISNWAEPQMKDNAAQITDIQEQLVETEYQQILDELEV